MNESKGLPIDMTENEKIAAMMAIGTIFRLSEAAMALDPELVAVAVKLQGEFDKHVLAGPVADIPELSRRIVVAFAEWHGKVTTLLPAIAEIGDRPPLTDEDIRHVGKERER